MLSFIESKVIIIFLRENMKLSPAGKETIANPGFQRIKSDLLVINRPPPQKKKFLRGSVNDTF